MRSILKKLQKKPIDSQEAIKSQLRENLIMPKTFTQKQQELEAKLNHTFRYGSSAFRFGLVPKGVSDHLPIVSQLPLRKSKEINMMSWNLLADEHLFNNFMNISGSLILQDAINEKIGEKENIYNGSSMYHLFAELAQFIYDKIPEESNEIIIDAKLLNDFIFNNSQPSRLARSRTPETAQEKARKVEKARRALTELLSDPNNQNAQEYQLAIKHSMELIYHIKNPNGVLKWKKRFSRLKENKNAVAELVSQDLLALQECSSPSDIESLFKDNQEQNKDMVFISHNTSNSLTSTDNVVLAYDQHKFNLVETTIHENPLRTNFEGKKPAVFCKLQDKISGEMFIFGSIHHPGGAHDLRHEIVNNIKLLQGDEPNMPFFIAGDYNHTAEQFAKLNGTGNSALPQMFNPTNIGTMAGSDYGNTNKSIDAIMSNEDLDNCIAVSSAIKFSAPAKTPINISFELSAIKKQTKQPISQELDSSRSIEQESFVSEPDDINVNNMKNNILMAIIIAKDNYLQKTYRPGYPQTHKSLEFKEKITEIENLYSLINETNSPIMAVNYLTDQLTDQNANWHNYDFNNYIIDALKLISRDPKQSIATIDWDCFTPTAVKRFEGVVYRGTSSPPEKVFNKGFTDYVPSSDISDYTKVRNLNTGISTSRSYKLAESYTKVASRKGKSRFVYTILYRGQGAVDIVETSKARGIDLYSMTNPQVTKALEKDEINIIEKIPPEQILYATEFLEDGSQIIHKNPNYNGKYIVENITHANERPLNESNLFTKIYKFFAEIISFVKVFKWSIDKRETINDYGIDYRKQEIESNPLMQKAEATFNKITNANSFDLISAHLSIDAPLISVITDQPDDAEKIVTDVTVATSPDNGFEIIDEIDELSELVTLAP